ncbi:MAG: hypothetical protein NC337_05420 [Roseburia sp.]|nr:hypothetical protein [Roseburia sp.]
MDRTEFCTLREKLLESVRTARMVLIGVGEEFNEGFRDIGRFPRLMSALKEVDINPALEWTVPFLEQLYLERTGDGIQLEAYAKLYELIKDKDYFFITTCIDGHIRRAGFALERIVEPCGSYERLQCRAGCCDALYPSEDFTRHVRRALADGAGLDTLTQRVCPECGEPLVFNNITVEGKYVEAGYRPQWERYTKWLQGTLNKELCILELGVGMSLPDVIRWPFEKIAFYNRKADFFRVNGGIWQMTEELKDKGISIEMNAVDFLRDCDLSHVN